MGWHNAQEKTTVFRMHGSYLQDFRTKGFFQFQRELLPIVLRPLASGLTQAVVENDPQLWHQLVNSLENLLIRPLDMRK